MISNVLPLHRRVAVSCWFQQVCMRVKCTVRHCSDCNQQELPIAPRQQIEFCAMHKQPTAGVCDLLCLCCVVWISSRIVQYNPLLNHPLVTSQSAWWHGHSLYAHVTLSQWQRPLRTRYLSGLEAQCHAAAAVHVTWRSLASTLHTVAVATQRPQTVVPSPSNSRPCVCWPCVVPWCSHMPLLGCLLYSAIQVTYELIIPKK